MEKLYHGTKAAFQESILDKGLLPSSGEDAAVYLTHSLDDAVFWASLHQRNEHGKVDVYEIATSSLDTAKLSPGMRKFVDKPRYYYAYPVLVPADALRIVATELPWTHSALKMALFGHE